MNRRLVGLVLLVLSQSANSQYTPQEARRLLRLGDEIVFVSSVAQARIDRDRIPRFLDEAEILGWSTKGNPNVLLPLHGYQTRARFTKIGLHLLVCEKESGRLLFEDFSHTWKIDMQHWKYFSIKLPCEFTQK